ncbi:MAG: helix-turn-helix transcriptional regulator [Selenomonadaceae bacterium]|nr:helix-turn-helix transcriptional regulator [Selenomonadaceae bacterium]
MEKVSVGKLLKDRRNELALTQRQIANQVGVTEATVSRWESGDIDNMRRDKIASLANALRVSPLLIMGIDDTEHFYKPVNKDELELLDDYRGVDVDDRNMIRNMLKRFKIGRVQSVNQAMAM